MPGKSSLTAEHVLTLLAATPPRIAVLAEGRTPAQLHSAPKEDEWSANDVLAHLRACADVWGDCIMAIAAQDGLTLRAVNPRTWIKQTDYPLQEFQPSMQAYTAQRVDLLRFMRPLPQEVWSRSATVTGAGKALQRTVLFYAEWLARHERPHLKQIECIVNTMPRK